MENPENITKKELYDQKKQGKKTQQEKRKKGEKIRSRLIWAVAIVAIILAVAFMAKLASNAPEDPGISINAIALTDHVKGNPDAKVILTEYSDFQCPACALYVPFVESTIEKYKDKVAFVYRHFPLVSIHPNAEPSARASEAAGKQDAFWQMHDKLFDNQTEWSDAPIPKTFFLRYARDLNLDLEKFEADYSSREVKDKVEADKQSGLRARLSGTPTFFINGNKIKNPRNEAELSAILDTALNFVQAEETINSVDTSPPNE